MGGEGSRETGKGELEARVLPELGQRARNAQRLHCRAWPERLHSKGALSAHADVCP